MNKVIFLDRDGTLNKRAGEHQYIKSDSEFVLLDDVIDALQLLIKHDFTLIIVSNQQGISTGKLLQSELDSVTSYMLSIFKTYNIQISGVYYCTHLKGTCNCRKPDIGLFLQAEAQLGKIDKRKSWMIGDSATDIIAGKHYNINTALIGTENYNQDITGLSLYQIAQQITGDKIYEQQTIY